MPLACARRNADRLSWTTPSDELLVRLRILNGRDADLAADATGAANRLRDALLTVSPALERALGDKLANSGGARDALARWGTPTALRSAGRARIRTRIAKRSPRTADRLTDAICGVRLARRLEVEGACEEGGHLCSCDGLVGAEPPRLASAANSDPGREQCLDVGGVHTGGIRVREPRRP